MADKRIRYGSNTVVVIALIIGILVLVNYLSSRRFLRFDLTEDKRYTVSKATKSVIKNLDDIVTITAYFSTEPAEINRIRRDVRDVLDEYDAFSQKLKIKFIDPGEFDETQKQELRFKGIPELPMNVVQRDKVVIANVYRALSIGYSGKEEVLPDVRSASNLEYELTSTILKVTTKEAKTIGFLTGHQEFDINAPTQELQHLRELLDISGKGQYNLSSVDLKAGEPVDTSVTTLVVAGPKQELSEREKYEIDQFIMRGGRVIFLIDPVTFLQPQTVQATPLSTGLNDLLEHYGVKLGNNIVADLRFHDSVQVQQGFVRFVRPYPYFVKIIQNNFSKENVVTSQLESLTLPWTSSLDVLTKEGVIGTALAKTSEFGQSSQGFHSLMPGTPIPNIDTQVYTVAAALEGKFKSFYAGKEIPPLESAVEDGDDAEDTSSQEVNSEERTTIADSAETQIIVVGTSQFLTQINRNSVDFLLNSLDWLTLGETLIGIRSYTITDRPLRDVSGLEKNFIKYFCLIGIPLLVVLIGLIRYLLRRRVKRLVAAYGSDILRTL